MVRAWAHPSPPGLEDRPRTLEWDPANPVALSCANEDFEEELREMHAQHEIDFEDYRATNVI